MKKNRFLLLLLGVSIIYGCKKDSDPFFDSFPKKFIYSASNVKNDIQLFTNGTELTDSITISNFVNNNAYFDLNYVSSYYYDSYFEFETNNIIKYSGFDNYSYDTLYYTKTGEDLHIKTEKIYSFYHGFNCSSIFCKMDLWKTDSVGVIELFGDPVTAIFVLNKEYTISNNEIHIPVLGYKLSLSGMGGSYFKENEFNSEVIKDLTSVDTLAIVKFEMIFKQE
jgi:hypothetical protein